MVVTEHFIRQSPLLASATEVNGIINAFLGSGGRIAVNIFLLIGSWFMVDTTVRPIKALRLYLTTAFYCIPITLLTLCLGVAGDARNVLQGLLPFFGRPVWFATAYISLIIIAPFLNAAFLLPPRKQAWLAGALLMLFGVVSTIPSFSNIDYIADFSWFCVVYVIIGCAKNSGILAKVRINRWIYAASGILIYAGLCLATRIPFLTWAANYWLDNIRSLPNIACAFCIFAFFTKTRLGRVGFINSLSRSVFATYIIHQIPAFREFLWNDICQAGYISTLPPVPYAASILGVGISVLITASLLDIPRAKLFAAIEGRIAKGHVK